MGSVASALQRCYREQEMPNADAERTPKNEYDVCRIDSSGNGQITGFTILRYGAV